MAKTKKIPTDQFQNLELWISFYKENKKLPYNEITCCKCKMFTAKLKGAGMRHALKAANNDIKTMLSGTMCKECKSLSKPKEKKVIQKKVKTQWEIEEEIEKIRREMPKIDLQSANVIIDLRKNKSECEKITATMCMRPDIFLDNDRTCDYCHINQYCACPIKKFAKKHEKPKPKN